MRQRTLGVVFVQEKVANNATVAQKRQLVTTEGPLQPAAVQLRNEARTNYRLEHPAAAGMSSGVAIF